MDFKTINQNAISEIIEKKSKFIGNLFYIESIKDAEKIIKKVKKENINASHNVYAYSVVTENGVIFKCSDDGEPSGTAGAPILNIIKQNELTNILIIVTRYFGGILLGTGGLCRAYTKAATSVLEKVEVVHKTQGLVVKLNVKYEELDKVKYYCKQSKIKIIKTEFLDNVEIIIEISENLESNFKSDILKLMPKLTEFSILQEKYIEINH